MRVRHRSVYFGVAAWLAINYATPGSTTFAQSIPTSSSATPNVAQPTDQPTPAIVFSPKHSPRAMAINPTGQTAVTETRPKVSSPVSLQPRLVKPMAASVMQVSHEQPIAAQSNHTASANVPTANVPTANAPTANAPTANAPTANVMVPNVPAQTVSVPSASGIPLQPMIPSSTTGIVLSPLTSGSFAAASVAPSRPVETAQRPASSAAVSLQPMYKGGENPNVPPQHIAGLPFAVLPMTRYDNSGQILQAKPSLNISEMTGPMTDPLVVFQQLNTQTPAPGPISGPQRTMGDYVPWSPSSFTWHTPVFAHHPLYFEQPNLERYGIGTYRWLQPAASSAHFFTSIGLMPYKVMTQHPREAVYTLGFDRPGNCAAYQGRPVLGQSSLGESLKYWDSCSGYQ